MSSKNLLDALPPQLPQILTDMRMAFWHWDPASDTPRTSGVEDLWGIPPGQTLTGLADAIQLVHPEDRERHAALIGEAREKGLSWHSEFRVIRPRDGRVVWLEEHARATRDPATGIVSIAGLTRDITARKEAEEATHASEEKYRTLFNSIDEGFAQFEILYDDSGKPCDALLREHNPRFDEILGVGNSRGKTNLEIFPGTEPSWFEIYAEVAKTGIPARFQKYFAPLDKWFEVSVSAAGPTAPDQIVVVFSDATERLKSAEVLRASEEKYRTLFNSIDEGFCLVEMVFDAAEKPVDFVYLDANPGFVRHAGFDPVGKRVRELLPDYEQALLDHYARALASEEVVRLEHPVKGLGGQWFRSTAFRYGDPAARRVAIVFTNITAERNAAETTRLSEARGQFLVRLEDALRPLEHSSEIQATAARLLGEQLEVDRVYYADIDESAGIATIPSGYALGHLSSIAGQYPLDLFMDALRPLRRGKVLQIPDTANAPEQSPAAVEAFQAWGAAAILAAPLMKNGVLRWALSILHGERRTWSAWEIALVRETAERTWAAVRRAQAEEALRKSEEKYRALFDTIDEGFCLLQLIIDENGKAADFEYLETNPAFVRHAGMEMKGRRIKEIFPDFEQIWIDHYGRVAMTGEVVRLESKVEGLDRWFQTTAFRYGAAANHQVAVVFSNVTERKRSEQALRDFNARLESEVRLRTAQLNESRDLLRSVLDTSLVGMSYMQARRDEQGKVVDFEIRMINKELERETGRSDLVGKLYGQELPGIHDSGIFGLMVEVLETGKTRGLEYYYPHDGFDKWFSSMFVKFEDGIVATNLDISRQKKIESDLKSTLAALELENKIHAYAEEIANMGTWTWNTGTDVFTYSDNLFRLFGMRPGEVEPGLQEISSRIHPEDRERVRASSEALRKTGERAMALEYRIVRKDGSLRHFSNRVQKVADLKNGHLLVGITEDVTERKLEETHNRQLLRQRSEIQEHQRLALLAATLTTQEEERRRIAESLHNGIGQMLYGIQINLNLLDLKPGDAWNERHVAQQKRTTELLRDAIDEARRVSHELMPSVLEDFGLKAAVEELCSQFKGKLEMDCGFSLLPDNIPQYVSIALYRTLQELMTNVVKHANAGRMKVHVRHAHPYYELEVKDDGLGFDPGTWTSGIGLKTLREKITLMNGKFQVKSSPEGTIVQVKIPGHLLLTA